MNPPLNRWLADENFPVPSFRLLQEAGWDIAHVGLFAGGISDANVLKYAIAENQIVLTFDSDYGTLLLKEGYRPPGIVYFRLTNYLPEKPGQLMLAMHAADWPFAGNLCVVDNDTTRIRPIPTDR